MAETSDSRGKNPLPGKRDPSFPHSPNGINGPTGAPAVPAGMQRKPSRSKKESWFQQNRTLAVGIAAGVTTLVLVLVLCWMSGVFGGPTKTNSPAVAAQPGAPAAPPTGTPSPSQPQAQPSTDQPPSPDVKKEEPKKEEPKKDEKPPLPDDVSKWSGKAGDYLRAKRENHPKLLEAIARLGEKYPGSEPIARGLTELLKPLPPEKPPADKPPTAPGAPSAPPGGPTMPPGGPTMPPGGPTPRSAGGGHPMPAGGGNPMPAGGGPPMPPPTLPPNAPGPDPNAPTVRPYTPADLTKLVETIVEALGRNGTDVARGTLEQVLAGTFATDDDKAAVEATLKTLTDHPSGGNDALMLRVLTAADDFRPAGRQGPWTLKDMKAKAFDLVKASASSGLRTKMAAGVIEKHARVDPKEPIDEFLLAPNPLNCGAQLTIYEKANPSKEIKATLEQQLTNYASLAMARCLEVSSEGLPASVGLPMGPPGRGNGPPRPGPQPMPGGMPGSGPPPSAPSSPSPPSEPAKPVEADIGAELAAQLWSEAFRGVLQPQLAGLRSLEKQSSVVLLAATIPQDSTRAALHKMFRDSRGKRWDEGPKALESGGLIDRVITDPGLLVTIKTLPRSPSSATPLLSEAAKAGRGSRPPLAGPTGAGKVGDAQKKMQARQEWMDVSAKLVTGWCKRFETAETAKEKNSTTAAPAVDAADLKLPGGFALGAGAKVLASHRIVLPDAAPAGIAQAKPDSLEVYYVRAEESNKLKRAKQHYQRQAAARDSDTRQVEGKKIWIDGLRLGSSKDRRRSVDVLITQPETASAPAAGPIAKEEEADLTIEVLIIEIRDPSKEPSNE